MSNTGRNLNELMNGIGGLQQASTGQTGAQRAQGVAQIVQTIMALWPNCPEKGES